MSERRRTRRRPSRFGGAFARLSVVGLALAAVGLAVFTRGADWVDASRGAVDDAMAPTQNVSAAPFAAIRRLGDRFSEHMDVVEENRRLREQNAELMQWYDLARSMIDKMERYERLLNVVPDPTAEGVVARLVGETSGPFVRARLVNAGREHGVEPGQAALSERGLVGRVVTAGRRSARILLLSDINSRVPVIADRNDTRAILAGDNTDLPRLEFLPRGHGLREGDRIVTSGDAGLLPRGLAVGVAFNDDQGVWRVRPYASDAPIDYVRVVRFSFPASPEEEAAADAAAAEAAAAEAEAEAEADGQEGGPADGAPVAEAAGDEEESVASADETGGGG